MELIYPSYYKSFVCIADKCPDSCCHEWDVEVDEATAACYRAMEGELGADLRKDLYEEGGRTYLRNRDGRCPMWRADGLCRIQAELGHDALSNVCRQFPRLTQDYGYFVELGLEMSCPEAARIMLTNEGWDLISEEQAGGEEPDYDTGTMEILRRSRPRAFEILADRRYTVQERLAIIIMYGYHIQSWIDGAEPEPFDSDLALKEARGFAGPGDTEAFLEFFRGLEILTDRWEARLERGSGGPVWDKMLCKLAEYLLHRYYYQAVSDYDLVCRVKLSVVSCIAAALLSGADPEERISLIQLYSKEIENNIQNTEALLDGAHTAPALTDRNLLGLLLG